MGLGAGSSNRPTRLGVLLCYHSRKKLKCQLVPYGIMTGRTTGFKINLALPDSRVSSQMQGSNVRGIQPMACVPFSIATTQKLSIRQTPAPTPAPAPALCHRRSQTPHLAFTFASQPPTCNCQQSHLATLSLTDSYKSKPIQAPANQWDIPKHTIGPFARFVHVVFTVMCKGCCVRIPDHKRVFPRSILGDYGHGERLSAWTHFIAALVFFVYAFSCAARFNFERAAEGWSTIAAFCVSLAFLSSTIYHAVSPDEKMSAVARQLDFLTIYIGFSVNAVADMAAVTRGFLNVPITAILDVPLASLILAVFFLYRRSWLSLEDTQIEEYGSCTLQIGLLRRWHSDGAHSSFRQAGSFAILTLYFTATPSIVATLGTNASMVLGLQVGALLIAFTGMLEDHVFLFPDYQISKGMHIPKLVFRRWMCCHASCHMARDGVFSCRDERGRSRVCDRPDLKIN